MLAKAKKHIIAALLISILIYILLALFSDINKVKVVIASFSLEIIPIVILFSVLTQFFRAVRWNYYLNELNIKVKFSDSIEIFMASLFLGFTPGKLGEGIKSYFLKQTYGISNSKTLPVVIIERISDILGLIIIASVGTLYYSWGFYVVIISLIMMIILLFMLSNKKIKNNAIVWLSKIKFIKKYTENLILSSQSVDDLVKFKPMIVSTFYSIAAWIFELLIFFLIINDFTFSLNFIISSFTYSISILAGSISMLPAGLGVTESSLSYLLIENGISTQVAVGATILVRLFTLWFTIILALPFFFNLKRKFLQNSTLN